MLSSLKLPHRPALAHGSSASSWQLSPRSGPPRSGRWLLSRGLSSGRLSLCRLFNNCNYFYYQNTTWGPRGRPPPVSPAQITLGMSARHSDRRGWGACCTPEIPQPQATWTPLMPPVRVVEWSSRCPTPTTRRPRSPWLTPDQPPTEGTPCPPK